MNRSIIICLLLAIAPFVLLAQNKPTHWSCGSDIAQEKAMRSPSWLQKHRQTEQKSYDFFAQNPPVAGKSVQLLTLPVVVHIIHDNGPENIPDAQVLAGIQQLNEAFANMAYYDQGSGTNTMIQFCLAKRTPDDQPTTGITRDQSPLTDLVEENDDIDLKDLNRWTPTDYINIWLVREICTLSSGCGVVGYAFFPSSHGNPEDGIVMEAPYLGSTPGNTGVLVHEMGHYLGLYHTFQGGCANNDCLADGDRVCDTPPDQSTLWVDCSAVVNTCNTDAQSGFTSDQPDMILNFMDYTDFNCFNDFTSGQSDRMHWHIENVRQSLLDSKACQDPCPNPVTANFTASAVSVNVGQTVNFTNSSTNAVSYNWTIDGTPFASSTNTSYTFNTAGTFTINLTANSGNPDLCYNDDFQVIVNVSCPVVAAFSVSNPAPAVGETVVITNQSQNATQYEWYVNGISQGATLPSFTPNSTGVFVLRLTAGNGFCEKNELVYLSVQDSCANVTFQKYWGDNNDNQGLHVVTLADGNFLVGGTTVLQNNTDIYLLKTTPDGTTLWQKRFGGPGTDGVRQLLALPDGGWIVIGDLPGPGGTDRPLVARFATDGTILWQKTMNTTESPNVFTDVILTQDGNLLLGGGMHNTNAIAYTGILTKMDLNGNVIWSNFYDGSFIDFIQGIRELPNGDIAAAGFTNSFGQNLSSIHDGMVMRFNSAGTLLWVNAYGSSDNEWLTDIFPTADGGLMAIGATSGWNGPAGGAYLDDGWLVKLKANGMLEWSQVFQTSQAIDFGILSTLQTTDGGYVFAGNDAATIGSGTPLMFKCGPTGDVEWSREYAGTGQDRLLSIDFAPDGYVLTGYGTTANKDVWLLKSDEAGVAGQCAEAPHSITKLAVTPVVTPGLINTLPPPPLIASNLTLSNITLTETTPCAADCITNAGCEDTWIKTFGINGPMVEGGNNIIPASDGNFFLSGYAGDSTLLMKMTPDGQMLWMRSFKFTSGTDERVSQMIEDSDGNLVGCGLFQNGQFIGFTFKYDPSADQVLWAYENPATPQTVYFAILEKSPGGNYLAFNSYHESPPPGSNDDAHIVEIDRNTGAYSGVKIAYTFGGSEGVIEAQLRNGSIYTSGRYTYGNNFSGMRGGLSRFDLSGNEIWSRMPLFDQSAQARNYAPDFVFDGDNMVTVYYGDFDSDDQLTDQFAVSKTDLNGNMIWSKLYTIADYPFAIVKSIVSVADGYIIAAANLAIDQPARIYLIKMDKNGNLLWARNYENIIVFRGEKMMTTAGEYVYFTGGTGSGDVWVVKAAISDGLVGGNCALPLDVVVTAQDLSPVSQPITLIQYSSPITQNLRNVAPHVVNLPELDVCKNACNTEICNNGLDDDGDGLFDCLDNDCDCNACDGEQSRFWYFGDGAGLDFSSDPPTVLTDGQTFSREASSVATDQLGNLLFYTDASKLFNRNHQLMPNGNNLDGHASTTQTLILPQPGQPWRFFVFTPNSYDNLGSGKGLSYSVVDMSLDGGLGDVVPGQKNIELIPQSLFTEKITATRHCNGEDWWILVKERGNNRFRAYPLSAAGLGAPVNTNIGTPGSLAEPNVIGCLKFSPNGRKVVNTLYHSNAIERFDFDNSTGQLQNPLTLAAPGLSGAYGVEFSPNGQLFYVTNLGAPSRIWQFDLNAGTPAAMFQSSNVLALFPDQYRFGQLQRAPNGKIYVTNTFPLQFTPTLGIIHHPNVQGLGCQYQQGGLNLSPGGANLGLPSFPQDFLPKELYLDITGSDSLCQVPGDLAYELKINDLCIVDSVRWTLSGTGTVLTETDDAITIHFDQAGTATLVATAFSTCANGTDTLVIHLFDNNAPVLNLGPDIQVCENGVQVLDAGAGFQKYRWNDGTAEQTLTTLFPGTYWVDVWDICGNKQSDTIQISVLPLTALNLGPDRLVCAGSAVVFYLPTGFDSWTWSPAAGLDCDTCQVVHATVTDSTTYTVVAQNAANCLSADTIAVTVTTETIFASLDTTVCSNETLLLLGVELPADTVAVLTLTTPGGCDSVLTITVTGIDPVQSFSEQAICPGDTVVVNGASITTDTTLQFVFTGENGCDSIAQVSVVLLDTSTTQLTLSACAGGFAVYNDVNIPAGQTHIFHLPGGAGVCDSTVVVTVLALAGPLLQLLQTDTLVMGDTLTLNPVAIGMGPFQWQWTPAPPPDWLSCYDCQNPVATPLATVVYAAQVTDVNGCGAVDSIELVVLPCEGPYIPNAFTPDDDGTNDWFYLLAPECVIQVHFLRIYEAPTTGSTCWRRNASFRCISCGFTTAGESWYSSGPISRPTWNHSAGTAVSGVRISPPTCLSGWRSSNIRTVRC